MLLFNILGGNVSNKVLLCLLCVLLCSCSSEIDRHKAKELCKHYGGVYKVKGVGNKSVTCNSGHNPISTISELLNYTIKDPKYFVKGE